MKQEAVALMGKKDGKRFLKSPDYNFVFDMKSGFFARWGKTEDDDPQFSPYGPEILDLEISTSPKCSGRCKFCYKKNAPGQEEHNMTFDEFVTIFQKMPPTLTQIAFGICDIDTNPDFFRMMEYAREHDVIPNYTCNGHKITPEIAKKTAELCGAVAVSLVTKEKSYDAIGMFTEAGMTQVNIHYMLSDETYDRAFEVVDEIASDPRLKKLNAIVFLQYKPKGNNTDAFHSCVNTEKYKKLMAHCEANGVNYGFDSCSAPVFMDSIQGRPDEKRMAMMAEPCESGLFSSYINCHGQFFVCSFAEGEDSWLEGLDVLGCKSFLVDIWYNERLVAWRDRLIANDRECPIYDLKDHDQFGVEW